MRSFVLEEWDSFSNSNCITPRYYNFVSNSWDIHFKQFLIFFVKLASEAHLTIIKFGIIVCWDVDSWVIPLVHEGRIECGIGLFRRVTGWPRLLKEQCIIPVGDFRAVVGEVSSSKRKRCGFESGELPASQGFEVVASIQGREERERAILWFPFETKVQFAASLDL